MSLLRLKGGTIHDPANGVDGHVRDLWIEDGKIIPKPVKPARRPDRTIDLAGYVVMPGGVEMHCHIAGPKVNAGRRLFPDVLQAAPTTRATGRLFAGVGYTTAFDAAIPPLLARHAHLELADTPMIDKGCYLLFDNNHYVLDAIRSGNEAQLDNYIAWVLRAAKGYAIKLVNPGGVENWKQISRKTIRELDQPVATFAVTPRQIVHALAATADRLKLPHPTHIHANNLGIPGNWRTTLETMKALDGYRGHFAHIQFHSYAGDPNDQASFRSGVQPILEYLREHPEISVDVGHIHPGRTLSMTGDAPFAQYLRQLTGGRWYAADCEQESSCGVLPVEYKPQKSLVHAVQWAIGLEWYLLMDDPWRLAMTSDHPNGGAFTRYPEMIHLLMDRAFRAEAMRRMPADLVQRCTLAELEREYTMQEIAIITRAAPARLLGLANKGHLGVGADADVTVYLPQQNKTEMFSRPRYVFKAGQLIVDDGQILSEPFAGTYTRCPEFDPDDLNRIRDWFQTCYSIQFANYSIADSEIPRLHEPCG